MTIAELKSTLNAHPDKKLRFVLPDKSAIPAHFHITVVGHVRKDFIDCGGTLRAVSSCVLQAWVAQNDEITHWKRVNSGRFWDSRARYFRTTN